MKRELLTLLVASVLLSVGTVGAQITFNQDYQEQRVLSSLSSMPLGFTENRGQFAEGVLFKAEAGGVSFYFYEDEVAYLFIRDTDELIEEEYPEFVEMRDMSEGFSVPKYKKEALLVKAQFIGAHPNPEIAGVERLPHNNNYFLGNDPSKWRTNVPNYRTVVYKDIYDGIDLKYYGDGRALKYDFIVKPGADVSQIKIRYDGVDYLNVAPTGDLEIQTPFGPILERTPRVSQNIKGQKQELTGRYRLVEPGVFGFEVDEGYDRSFPLTIDPVLVYSSYLGGASEDWGFSIDVVQWGLVYFVYVAGFTWSTDFPTFNPWQPDSGSRDVFVTKLLGGQPIYSTYLGGGDEDWGFGIAVDNQQCAYVTGYTMSDGFPTTNGAYDEIFNGQVDAFVTKLSMNGDALHYSTYLGGSSYDAGYAIAVDGSGFAYITGMTYSTNFDATSGAFQTGNDGYWDAFVTKLSQNGSSLDYSTYLGGSYIETGCGIAVDASGLPYVTGWTWSHDFDVQNAYDASLNGSKDVFVTKFSSGSSLAYSTYLGGMSDDYGKGIAVDGNQCAYVTGRTWSTDFDTTDNPHQGINDGDCDVFVTKLSGAGSSLIYSTYLGGDSLDYGNGIAVNDTGYAYVTGWTWSTNFDTTEDPHQGSNYGKCDVFLSKFSVDGSGLDYSTYLGGTSDDFGRGIAVCDLGYVITANVTGKTGSIDFDTTFNAWKYILRGPYDAFVSIFLEGGNLPPIALIDNITPNPATEGEEVTFVGHGLDWDGSINAYNWSSDPAGLSSSQSSCTTDALPADTYVIYFEVQDNDLDWSLQALATLQIDPATNYQPTASIDIISPNPANPGDPVTFAGSGEDINGSIVGYNWRSNINGKLSTDSSFSTADLDIGTHTIYFKVQDDDGAWSEEVTRVLDIRTGGNYAPTASIDIISPNPAKPGDTISFAGSGEDVGGSVVGYNWRSSINGQLSTEASFSAADLDMGTHTIYFKVQDNDGAWSEETSQLLNITVGEEWEISWWCPFTSEEEVKLKMLEPHSCTLLVTNITQTDQVFIYGLTQKAEPRTWVRLPGYWAPVDTMTMGWQFNEKSTCSINDQSYTFGESLQDTILADDTEEYIFTIKHHWNWIEEWSWKRMNSLFFGIACGYLANEYKALKVYVDSYGYLGLYQNLEAFRLAIPQVKYTNRSMGDAAGMSISSIVWVKWLKPVCYVISIAMGEAASYYTGLGYKCLAGGLSPYAALAFFVLEALHYIGAEAYYWASADPDPNYTEMVHPSRYDWVETVLDPVQPGWWKDMAYTGLEMVSVSAAYCTTFTKYLGALDAGATEWAIKQHAAAREYLEQQRSLTEELYSLMNDNLDFDTIPDLSATQIDSIRTEIKNSGLPQIEKDILSSFGVPADTITYIGTTLADSLNSSLFENVDSLPKFLADLDSMLDTLRSSLFKDSLFGAMVADLGIDPDSICHDGIYDNLYCCVEFPGVDDLSQYTIISALLNDTQSYTSWSAVDCDGDLNTEIQIVFRMDTVAPALETGKRLLWVSGEIERPSPYQDTVFFSGAAVAKVGYPTIRVDLPYGGEELCPGSLYTIKWESFCLGANVRIDYSLDDGQNWDPQASTANTGSYDWTVPPTASTKCKVRICDTVNDSCGISHGVFTIKPVSIHVTDPDGGEVWCVGENEDITWDCSCIDDVKIQRSPTGGPPWTDIIGSYPCANGSYRWTVELPVSDQYRVKISDLSDVTRFDISDNPFTIEDEWIQVLYPNGGETWAIGSNHTINWSSACFTGTVKIHYSTNSGGSFPYEIAANCSNTGYYSWNVPDTPSEKCRVRVCDAANCAPGDMSDADFTISVYQVPSLANYGIIVLLALLILIATIVVVISSRKRLAIQRHK